MRGGTNLWLRSITQVGNGNWYDCGEVELFTKSDCTIFADKHSTESLQWKRMYNILMQEVIEAKKYLLKSLTQTGQEVVTGMKRGGTFSFNEEQRNYNEQVKRRRQETVPGNIS